MSAAIYRRCGCRDENGRQLGASCPRLAADRKHGSWGFTVAAGYRVNAAGKRVRHRIRQGGYPTRKAAEAAALEAASSHAKGTYVAPSRLTVAEYMRAWLKRRQSTGTGLKPSTFENYSRYLEQDIVPDELAAMHVTEVRRHHLNAFLDRLTAAGRGATTVRRIAAVLQGAFRAAALEDAISENPATGLRLPRVESREFEPWQPGDVGAFLDAAATHRLGPLFEVAVFTGLRRAELLGLRWSDIDLAQRQLTVRTTRVQTTGAVVENAPKTRAGRRVVQLDDAATGPLISWRLAQQTEAEAWGSAWAGTGHVFTDESGAPLKPQYVTRAFAAIVDRINAERTAENEQRDERGDAPMPLLPRITFHGLRHMHASLLLAGGADIALVSKRLGHSSVSVTADVYSHLIGDAARQAAASASALIPRGLTMATQGA